MQKQHHIVQMKPHEAVKPSPPPCSYQFGILNLLADIY